MTSEERAFLDAITAAPDDDTARLVYADWLDEHDQPERAEFIRVQCELARSPASSRQQFRVQAFKELRREQQRLHAHIGARGRPIRRERLWERANGIGDARYAERESQRRHLVQREQELLAEPRNFVNWTPSVMHTGSGAGIRYETGGTVGLFGKGFESAEFRRGFVASIVCGADAWIAHGDVILREHPVRRLVLVGSLACEARYEPQRRRTVFRIAGREVAITEEEVLRDPLLTADQVHDAVLRRRWPGVVVERPRLPANIPFGPVTASRGLFGIPRYD